MSLLHMKIIKKKENKRETRLMKNIEKYKDDIINAKIGNITCCVHVDILHLPCRSNCIECKKSVMEWLLSEYKEPILNDAEKKYLSAVIKPFSGKVSYILKQKNSDSTMEFIHIDLSDEDVADFPNFKANTMYKGMEVNKYYTLQELGL